MWGLIAAGVFARVIRYFANRPLWADEAAVALTVLEHSFFELWVPRPEDPVVTPVGFLLLTKAVTLVLGGGELALRLAPFLAGLLSLPLFYLVARELVGRKEALAALLLFSIAEPLIFYTSEMKQYSTDVWVGLLISWPGVRILCRGATPGRVAAAALAGGLGIWFSLPAVFVCGGLVAALGVRVLARDSASSGWRPLALLSLTFTASFLVCYFATLAPYHSNATLAGWWGTFYPPAPWSTEALAWYPRTFFGFFNDPVGFPAVGVAAAIYIAGAVRVARRDSPVLVLLLMPVALALAASALKLAPFPTSIQYDLLDGYYPFFGRVLLFSVPLALIVLGSGVSLLLEFSGRRFFHLGAVAIVVLLATPVLVLFRNALAPPVIQDMRALSVQMLPHAQETDLLFTLGYAEPVVDYYTWRSGLPRPSAVLKLRTRAHFEPLRQALAKVPPGGRFWLATVHHPHWPSRAEREALLPLLDRYAVELARFESYRGDAHLYQRP